MLRVCSQDPGESKVKTNGSVNKHGTICLSEATYATEANMPLLKTTFVNNMSAVKDKTRKNE